MTKRKRDTRWMVGVALMAAIVILLANTPLGMIPLPVTKATTVHVPVILGSIVLGPMAGGILGCVFGICSLISNTIAPSLTSFAFSPFMSTTGLVGAVKALWISVGCVFGICSLISNTIAPSLTSFAFSPFMSTTGLVGAVKALWISVGCRTLIGIVSGWLWIILKKVKLSNSIALPVVGFIGSMCNTVFVMGSIYFLLAEQYAQAKNVGVSAVMGLIMGTVAVNGIPEAFVALILVTAIGLALLKIFKKEQASQ